MHVLIEINEYSTFYSRVPGTWYVSTYSTAHLIRNRQVGPGWISNLRMGASYTNFSITTPEFLVFL